MIDTGSTFTPKLAIVAYAEAISKGVISEVPKAKERSERSSLFIPAL